MPPLSENLEAYATSRANFYHATPKQREEIARRLRIARNQAQRRPDPDHEDWERGDFRRSMERKREIYLMECAKADISYREASTVWWNYVYDRSLAPVDMKKVV